MNCYRDMTFCIQSDDCDSKTCPFKITKAIEAGSKLSGKPISAADLKHNGCQAIIHQIGESN